MDIGAFIPIAAIVVGVPGVVAFVSLLANHTRKMKELEVREKEAGADALRPAVDALTDDVHDLRSHLAEVQERLDFAERMLAAGKPAADD
ncbi:MAG: radical SAM protein [Gemmatimonadetes bacterium]|nr:radical SAM protein [Gemmatimonadota bacterium]MCA9767633.1 radical SAM protein [Gemmatimonadota bacterium]